MFAQRVLQSSTRRLVNQRPSSVVTFASPAAVATSTRFLQRREVTSQNVSKEAAGEILAKQRLRRPVSPHLSIYRWQITWIPSAANRVTGVALSGLFYLYGIGYLIAPAMGWHLESAVVAASVAAWPVAAKVLLKTTLALPFTFHSLNGLRHLTWDLGKMITNKKVQQTGWTVVIASVLSALYLGAVY
ncbi:succinate dehydrogenase, cytochrome b556 subunit [Verruconis gallopava]|uniref:Succinate dehydrogenase, cytochrome b556 subunit n=1 Tax=Verruconis gallopava TaxID=253628 RepID=A0A0D2B744_9PEZI|nr:succinate dehydrogenase, cytochrome b556 subunit [Verruconis gallopava]KIW07029.1 succinate dehydrogenase, cytochrome b556 subunit [Verruconis gallopava]